jgi:hypothetical protein
MLRREQAGALPVLISSPGGAAAAGMAAAGLRAASTDDRQRVE